MQQNSSCENLSNYIFKIAVLSLLLTLTIIFIQMFIVPMLLYTPTALAIVDTDCQTNHHENKSITVVDDSFEFETENVSVYSSVVEKLTYRLPNEIVPFNYKLYLHPDLIDDTFSGNVEINFKILKYMSFIPIHMQSLTISETKLYRSNYNEMTPINIKQCFEYTPFQYWVTELDTDLTAGNYTLYFKFNGTLATQLFGIYKNFYFDRNRNQTRKLVTSKFQPTYARKGFPCFDEPAIKAEFEITLVRPTKDYHALSNMNMIGESMHPNNTELTIVRFAKSVPMSTYLVCFTISDFVMRKYPVKSSGYRDDFEVGIVVAPTQLNKIEYAGINTAKTIEYYTRHFEVPYPLPKLDIIAIPNYGSGATEHWGIVTYREMYLLYDPFYTSTINRQFLSLGFGHELSHMWFGNLVTMKWWDETWLNEGFARYMEYKCTDTLRPWYGVMDQINIKFNSVYELDATLNSHPIVQTVTSPNQITSIFDIITYNKGAAVIRMTEHFIGEENFRKSVSNYLKQHKFSSATTLDLLAQIEKIVPNIDIKLYLNTWVKQKGLPYVIVQKLDNSSYRLFQKRFLIDPENYGKDVVSEFRYRWQIPITYHTDLTSNNEFKRKLFVWDSEYIDIEVENNHSWLKINKDQVGFYRVLYPTETWKNLISALKTNKNVLSISDRSNLIDDAFSFAGARILPYDTAFELLEYLHKETDYVPWVVAAKKINKIANIIYYTDYYPKFAIFVRRLIQNAYDYVGWEVILEEEQHLRNLLRPVILKLACSVDHPQCLAASGNHFLNWINNTGQRPHPDLRHAIYYYGIQSNGNADYWEKMLTIYRDEQDSQEKSTLLCGLAGIQNPLVLNKFLHLANHANSPIIHQDYYDCMKNIASNKIAEPLVWDFIRTEWEALIIRFTINDRYFGRMIEKITSKFTTKIKLEEMYQFFAKYPKAGAGATARSQAIENVKNNINWVELNSQTISEWLERNV